MSNSQCSSTEDSTRSEIDVISHIAYPNEAVNIEQNIYPIISSEKLHEKPMEKDEQKEAFIIVNEGLKKLKEELDKKDSQIELLNARIKELEGLKNFGEKYKELQEELDKKDEQMKVLVAKNEKFERLQEELDNKYEQIATLTARNEKLEKLEEDLEEKIKLIQALRIENDKLKCLQGELEEKDKRIEALKKEITGLTKNNQKCKKDIGNLRKNLNEQEAKHKKEREDAESEYKKSKEEIKNLSEI